MSPAVWERWIWSACAQQSTVSVVAALWGLDSSAIASESFFRTSPEAKVGVGKGAKKIVTAINDTTGNMVAAMIILFKVIPTSAGNVNGAIR